MNDQTFWASAFAALGTILGSVLTLIAALYKIKKSGLTAEEAIRLSDRKTFRDEMMLILEKAKESEARSKKEAYEFSLKNLELVKENIQFKFEFEALKKQFISLQAEFEQYKKDHK